jgi:hypothetical protein
MNQPQTPPPGQMPSEDEMRAQMEAELRRLRVDDVLLQTVVSLINLGARRAGLAGAGADETDLEQVRSAIDAVVALLPIVERGAGGEDAKPLRDAVSQLQMAYTRARGTAGAESGASPPGPGEPAPPAGAGTGGLGGEGDPAEGEPKPGEPGPAQSSGRLWVPGQ